MRITLLNENTVNKRGLLGEHGLSLLIEYEGQRILFDTGQTDVFLKNAETLGVDLRHLDAIVLSHGHYDHCGGLRYLDKELDLPPVYVRREAFYDKYAANKDGTYRRIGIPWNEQECSCVFRMTEELEQIKENMYLLGRIPYTIPMEKKPDSFFIKMKGRFVPDEMNDEQMLIIRTGMGLSVFLGCSHAGILNCLTYVKRVFPGEKLYSVLAGMHLTQASAIRVEETIRALEEMEIRWLIPVHCTGQYAIGRMKETFGDSCILGEAGKGIDLK